MADIDAQQASKCMRIRTSLREGGHPVAGFALATGVPATGRRRTDGTRRRLASRRPQRHHHDRRSSDHGSSSSTTTTTSGRSRGSPDRRRVRRDFRPPTAGTRSELLSAMADAHLPAPGRPSSSISCFPRLSGLGVMRAFSRICRCPPTLIVTGFPDPSVDAFARTLGARRVLRKPIDATALCAAVREAAAARSQETRSLRAL